MPTLLAIKSSPRGPDSVSNTLTHSFVDAWKQAHGEGKVVVRDLYKTGLPFVDLPWIGGAHTAADKRTPQMAEAIRISDELIAELFAADHIVLGTPMYNFSIPAILKAYIDHIVRAGATFSTSYEGLLKGKKMTVIISSGSNYTEGSRMAAYNVESAYLKQIFGFIGITDITIVLAGDTNDMAQGKKSAAEFYGDLTPKVEAAAA